REPAADRDLQPRLRHRAVGHAGLCAARRAHQPGRRPGLRRSRPEGGARPVTARGLITATPATPPEPPARAGRGWLRNRTLLAGLVLLAVIAGMCAAAPLLASHDPGQQNLLHVLAGPSASHPLGTDDLGRDIWARLLYAGRTDLVIGFAAVIAPFVIGTALGLIAGYYGGWADAVIMR